MTAQFTWTPVALMIPVSPHGFTKDPPEYRRAEARERGGLAVHPSVDHRDAWVVTHVGSGKEVDCFFTRKKAEAFIEKILPLVDWTKPAEHLRGIPGLVESLRYARKVVERG